MENFRLNLKKKYVKRKLLMARATASSDDFLVAEEVFEICDLKIGRHEHNNDRNDAKNDHSALDL